MTHAARFIRQTARQTRMAACPKHPGGAKSDIGIVKNMGTRASLPVMAMLAMMGVLSIPMQGAMAGQTGNPTAHIIASPVILPELAQMAAPVETGEHPATPSGNGGDDTPALATALNAALANYRQGHFEQSARDLAPLAAQGDATAQYLLSCQMINGAGIAADAPAGWNMMTQAAANRQPDANVILARKQEAEGAPIEQIREHYSIAASGYHTQALLWLALDALDQDAADQAHEYLLQAWDEGDPRAATLLANRFAQDATQRMNYLKSAAERGEMRASAYLAEAASTAKDPVAAVGWCAIATGLPGHQAHADWKAIGNAVEKNCAQYDKDLSPAARAENRAEVDRFLADFFDRYRPWTPWKACALK